jgi:hypothetical protein
MKQVTIASNEHLSSLLAMVLWYGQTTSFCSMKDSHADDYATLHQSKRLSVQATSFHLDLLG